eukprot:655959-Amphidinium_carterae.1
MPHPQRRCVGSAGCFPLPSVQRRSSCEHSGWASAIVGRAVWNCTPRPIKDSDTLSLVTEGCLPEVAVLWQLCAATQRQGTHISYEMLCPLFLGRRYKGGSRRRLLRSFIHSPPQAALSADLGS